MSKCRKLINQWLRESIKALSRKFLFSFFFHYFSKDGADLVIRKTERSTSPGSSRGVIGGTRRRTERTVVKSGPAAPAVVPILCSTWSRCTVASGIFASIFRVKKNKSFFFFPFLFWGGVSYLWGGKRKNKNKPPLATSFLLYGHWADYYIRTVWRKCI